MSQQPDEPSGEDHLRRTQFLLTNLVILAIIILALVLLVILYPSLLGRGTLTNQLISRRDSPTPSPLLTLTPSPTASRTLRPTLTPSITLTPTETLTPSVTPTPPGPPTLVAEKPIIGDPYMLAPWTPEQADLMIRYMQDVPNLLPAEARGADNAAYYQAFYHATIAGREGLLRFPEADLADAWRWDLAYDLARNGNPAAAGQYAELVENAFNSAEVEADNLTAWLREKEPRLSPYIIDLEPPQGFQSSRIIDLYGPGSLYLWLVEKTGVYQAFELANYFDFVSRPDTASVIGDLDGDGQEEIGFYPTSQSTTFSLTPPLIFNLSQSPPSHLEFRPSQAPFNAGMEYKAIWGVEPGQGGKDELFLEVTLFPACPVKIRYTYEWDGQFLTLKSNDYQASPNQSTLSYCEFIVTHAANTWGPQAAATIIQQTLPNWPPQLDTQGVPYPPDAKDEWRFSLGIYQALSGDYDAAVDTLDQLIQQPANPTSRWIGPAEKFLETYQSSEDIYRACLGTELCNPAQALEALIRLTGQGRDAFAFLLQSGLAPASSGFFDFDRDGKSERWFTVRHRPLGNLEFWVLADSRQGARGLRVGEVGSKQPELVDLDDEQVPPEVLVDGNYTLSLLRDPDTSDPYLAFGAVRDPFQNRFERGLQAALEALFTGEDPAEVRDALLALQKNPGLLCRPTWSCDEYYYFLGLSHELAGDDRKAIENYLYLWWNYSKSPYATMARLKLLSTVTPRAPSPTPSILATPGTTTPTPTGFVFVPTETFGIYPSPTTDPYATLLTPPFPYPSPTETAYPGP